MNINWITLKVCLFGLFVVGPCWGIAQVVVITPPHLPTPSVVSPIQASPSLGGGYDWQKEQQAELNRVNEMIKRTDPTLRRIYYGDSERPAAKPAIRYALPGSGSARTQNFSQALRELTGMVTGTYPKDLKRAVFLSEHAYDTTLNFDQFKRQISKLVEVTTLEMKRAKIAPSDNIGKIMTLYKFMADTIRVRQPASEKVITTYPKLYDFDDFYGLGDYSKMFVSKLVKSGRGQCHSLPLLFLILCQEMKAEAYLAYAPEHSYIKFLDKNDNFQNIELTNRMFTSDQFILQSGYITSAAIKSRIYMDTVGYNRIILHRINDLANCYVRKFGYDDFVLACATKVLAYDPNNIQANMLRANYYSVLGKSVEDQYHTRGQTDINALMEQDSKFRAIVITAIESGKRIDQLGYAEMPPGLYAQWLNSLNNESMKQQHLDSKRILNTMMDHK